MPSSPSIEDFLRALEEQSAGIRRERHNERLDRMAAEQGRIEWLAYWRSVGITPVISEANIMYVTNRDATAASRRYGGNDGTVIPPNHFYANIREYSNYGHAQGETDLEIREDEMRAVAYAIADLHVSKKEKTSLILAVSDVFHKTPSFNMERFKRQALGEPRE